MRPEDLTRFVCVACGKTLADHRRADGRSIACRGVAPARIPDVLTLTQLCALLQLSVRTVYHHRRRHDHPAITELPRFTGHVRFSGAAVRDWLAGHHTLRLARRAR
jgi:predicted DNA-binding transcriptional regulator AlpA